MSTSEVWFEREFAEALGVSPEETRSAMVEMNAIAALMGKAHPVKVREFHGQRVYLIDSGFIAAARAAREAGMI